MLTQYDIEEVQQHCNHTCTYISFCFSIASFFCSVLINWMVCKIGCLCQTNPSKLRPFFFSGVSAFEAICWVLVGLFLFTHPRFLFFCYLVAVFLLALLYRVCSCWVSLSFLFLVLVVVKEKSAVLYIQKKNRRYCSSKKKIWLLLVFKIRGFS